MHTSTHPLRRTLWLSTAVRMYVSAFGPQRRVSVSVALDGLAISTAGVKLAVPAANFKGHID